MSTKSLNDHWRNTIADIRDNPDVLKDRMWRLEHLYIIVTKEKGGGRVPFKLNRAQKHFLANRKPRNLILKARQLGFTTLITILTLDDTLFTKNTHSLSIAHTKEEMSKIFDKKVRFAIDNMPEQLRELFNLSLYSRTQLKIDYKDNSSSSFSVAVSGRSGTHHRLHVSEFAKMCAKHPITAEEIVNGTFPSVPITGSIDVECTAEGQSGLFYEMWVQAEDELADYSKAVEQAQFYPHFYNWTWDDDEINQIKDEDHISVRDMKFIDLDWGSFQEQHDLSDKEITYYYLKWLSLNKNTDRLKQEYPTTAEEAFLTTGRPFFPASRVATQYRKAKEGEGYEVSSGVPMLSSDGNLRVLEAPKYNRSYVMGVDVAEGLEHGDFSAICVIDSYTRDVVATYKAKIEPRYFADVVFTIGKWYNTALVAIETAKDGNWVNDRVQRMGYVNLYFRETIDDITKRVSRYFGWETNSKTRRPMLTELKTNFIEKTFYSKALLEEMQTFVINQKGNPEAAYKKHDDLVMASAIAYDVCRQRYPKETKHITEQRSSSNYMDKIFAKR